MNVYVAGIHHNDAQAQPRLREWLVNLCVLRGEAPAWVGVEYDPRHLSIVQAARDPFREGTQHIWPWLDLRAREMLVRALGYDGDTHVQVFPGVPTLWLDEGRRLDSELTPNGHAEKLLQRYQKWTRSLQGYDSAAFLALITLNAWPAIPSGEFHRESDLHRQAMFIERLQQRVAQTSSGWAAAIVGADHAVDFQQSLAPWLDEGGHSLHVTMVPGMDLTEVTLCLP